MIEIHIHICIVSSLHRVVRRFGHVCGSCVSSRRQRARRARAETQHLSSHCLDLQPFVLISTRHTVSEGNEQATDAYSSMTTPTPGARLVPISVPETYLPSHPIIDALAAWPITVNVLTLAIPYLIIYLYLVDEAGTRLVRRAIWPVGMMMTWIAGGIGDEIGESSSLPPDD